jgi:predicted nucleotidyltransferase
MDGRLNQDHLDLLRAFVDAEVRFLIVGAHAVGYHVEPRATGDLDVWIEPTLENARKAHAALAAFGAPLSDLTVTDLATRGIVFQMGLPPNRIDVLTEISGVEFAEAWVTHAEASLGGIRVPVIGFDQLLANKRAAGRPKDVGDVAALERISKRRGPRESSS